MKYIVRNCPALDDRFGNKICCYQESYKPCSEYSDCLIKKTIQTTNDKKILDLFEIEVIDNE